MHTPPFTRGVMKASILILLFQNLGASFTERDVARILNQGIPVRVTLDGAGVAKELGKGIGEAVSQLGKGVASGSREWVADGGETGRNAGRAQTAFFEGMSDESAEGARHLRTMKNNYTSALINTRDTLRFAGTLSLGFFITAAAMATGYYGLKTFWSWVERKLQKPRVIISKKVGRWDNFKCWCKSWFVKEPEFNMVLDEVVKERLLKLVKATQNTNRRLRKKNTNVTYRNILLYGPPGTGKTMFARYLAHASGMDYAETTGGSFFQPGAGIAAVDELFDWAESGKRGLIIFIDEADSLFVDRKLLQPGSEEHRIVNHFLNRLGQGSTKFLLIAATNHKIVFDKAMHRRIHDLVQMPLPSLQTRYELLELYVNQLLRNEYTNGLEFVQIIDALLTPQVMRAIAVKTEGLCHADIANIVNTIKSNADITDDGLVTAEIIKDAVEQYVQKQKAFIQE